MPPYVTCGIVGVVLNVNCFGLSSEGHNVFKIIRKKKYSLWVQTMYKLSCNVQRANKKFYNVDELNIFFFENGKQKHIVLSA